LYEAERKVFTAALELSGDSGWLDIEPIPGLAFGRGLRGHASGKAPNQLL
jgi:hypothetical protein